MPVIVGPFGTAGFGQCTWYRSMRSVFSRRIDARARCSTIGASGMTGNTFVAMNTSLRNLVTGQELLTPGMPRAPWRLLPQGRLGPRVWSAQYVPAVTEVPVYEPRAFTAIVDDDHLELAWDASDGVRVEVHVAFDG